MSLNPGHKDLLKIFGAKPVKVPSDAIDKENNDEENDYKASNKSLVMKNAALKSEIAKLKNMVNSLREEILKKDSKISLLESEMDEEKIDFLVAERFQKKMAHMDSITERTILGLSKAAEEYRTVFLDMMSSVECKPIVPPSLPLSLQRKPPALRKKSATSQANPSLEKIQESPLVRNRAIQSTSSTEESPPNSMNITIRRTPKPSKISTQKEENPVNKICSTPKARVRSTPTRPVAMPVETDTVRRKRTAAAKITSMAEPSLNVKLRRPGKYDEPTPFISTDFM